jgi:hypothetical protein
MSVLNIKVLISHSATAGCQFALDTTFTCASLAELIDHFTV